MSLRPYVGEFLVHPVPLHFGGNLCSHNCWYCFSNLNKPDRRADFGSLNRAVKNVLAGKDTKSISERLLRDGYPVLFSNDADPFSKSNTEQFHQVLDLLQQINVPVSIQTRGGKGALEFMQSYLPTIVYISVTSDDNDIINRNEPGAPGFEERKELLLAAKKAGHFVVVGMNPFYMEWWQDAHEFVDWLAANGLNRVWSGDLHLSHMQVANIPSRRRETHAADIKYGMMRKKPDGLASSLVIDYAKDIGVNFFNGFASELGNFWGGADSVTGFKLFPTVECFKHHLYTENDGNACAFRFDYFDKFVNKIPEHRSSQFKEYLNSFGRAVRSSGSETKAVSLREVLDWIWNVLAYPTIMRQDEFYIATEGDNKNSPILTDDEGRDIFIYAPGYFSKDVFQSVDTDFSKKER